MSKTAEKPALLVRGDVVKLELDTGRVIEVPETWGIIHDPTGEYANRCDVYIAEYRIGTPNRTPLAPQLSSIARAYFGDLENLRDGTVDLPTGPWHRVGRVVRIYYARYGNQKGLYFHPFKMAVDLHEQQGGGAYLLQLPDGCVIDSHGFVWP